MQQDLQMLTHEKTENSICPNCGIEINKLLFTVVNSGFIMEEYYGCPYCLAKIKDIDEKKTCETPKNEITEDFEEDSKIIENKAIEPEETFSENEIENEEELTEANNVNENKPKPPGCNHQAGYLKNRPKDSPVPDECLTCTEMINCMIH